MLIAELIAVPRLVTSVPIAELIAVPRLITSALIAAPRLVTSATIAATRAAASVATCAATLPAIGLPSRSTPSIKSIRVPKSVLN